MTRWVCLDIGEVLVEETRVWATWAHLLDVPQLVLMAAIGAEIAAGRSYGAALDRFADDWKQRLLEHEDALGPLTAADLHGDAIPGIAALRAVGLKVAVIGNQPARRTVELRAAGVRPDVMAMSDEIGHQKPDPAFFEAVCRLTGVAAVDICYVGDRVDNDIVPARAAGMRTVHLRRGPWGLLGPTADGIADNTATTLSGVADALRRWARA